MMAMERLKSEQQFHDVQARSRARTFAEKPASLVFTDDSYLDHETWIRPAFARLGDIRGQEVLDFGCGHGMAAVVLARRGARVTAFDLSGHYLAEARARAAANGAKATFLQADAHRLPFTDKSFQAIWGCAVLHHLDLNRAAPEMRRVLKPDGVAVFCEPWGENPLLAWARRRLPYPGKHRTPEEQPLRRQHVRLLRHFFSQVSVQGYQLFSMARQVFGHGTLTAGLDWCDRLVLGSLPALEAYCRYVVVTLRP